MSVVVSMDAKRSRVERLTPRRTLFVVRFFAPLITVLLGAALFLFGLVVVGHVLRTHLAGSERFTISFAEIECLPVLPGQDRQEFLNEVQYLAEMPARVRLLEEGVIPRLTAAFLRHPWVERVERISRSQGELRVWLTYRTPVLAVPVDGQLRAVDAHGILLPANADVSALPVFEGPARPPAGPAGTLWGDSRVESAARRAAGRQ
jgi:hypothetical protein